MTTLQIETVPWSLLFQGLGPLAIVGVVLIFLFRLLATGKLRTGREVEELRIDRDERIRAAEQVATTWRSAFLAEQEARRLDEEAREGVLEMGKLTIELMEAVRKEQGVVRDEKQGDDRAVKEHHQSAKTYYDERGGG